jgi:hypothetical protein
VCDIFCELLNHKILVFYEKLSLFGGIRVSINIIKCFLISIENYIQSRLDG